MKKPTVIIIPIIILLLGGLYLLNNTYTSSSKNNNSNETPATTTDQQSADKSEDSAIEIKNFSFTPRTITVSMGTTITWTNQDSVEHSVVSDNNTFQSDLLAKDTSFSFTFTEPGEYTYHCGPHPSMVGTVIVK